MVNRADALPQWIGLRAATLNLRPGVCVEAGREAAGIVVTGEKRQRLSFLFFITWQYREIL